MYFIDGKIGRILPFVTGTGDVTKGDLVVISAGTVVRAAAATAAATVVGIALESAVATATVSVELFDDRLATATYAGTTKTTLTTADLGTVFDLTDAKLVNLDDVTGGICVCVGFDNNAGEIQFVIPAASKYL